MPRCGSQIALCDLPVRFDTYRACEHGCVYCFARAKRRIHRPNRWSTYSASNAHPQGVERDSAPRRPLTTNAAH